MIDIVIDKGIPIPPIASKGGRRTGKRRLYPWADMEVGDSFAVPADGKMDARKKSMTLLTIAHSPVSTLARRNWRFTARSFDDHVRIWRIE